MYENKGSEKRGRTAKSVPLKHLAEDEGNESGRQEVTTGGEA